jgi:hypothetical protein
MALLRQLGSLVRESNDPWLTLYVINHLGDDVPPDAIYTPEIQRFRLKMRQTLLWLFR